MGLILAAAGPVAALQSVRPVTTTAVPTVAAPAAASTAAPRTYAECLRSYAARTNAAAICQRLFPNATPSTTNPTGATPTTPTPEPVDITSQLDKLLDAWRNPPKTPGTAPADPLAVIPEIQAACAAYAAAPERWRRCTADGWRKAGLTGEPPLVLRDPPVIDPPPVQPPVVQPPVVQPIQPPPLQPPPLQPSVVETPIVQSGTPVQTPPPLTPETVQSEPVRPAPVVAPDPPPSAVAPPAAPAVPPRPPATPIWFWLLALVAAGGAGFGAARLLNRPRKPSARPATLEAAPCPQIALVADPGVVVLTPDGPPRAGMAVSVRVERAPGDGAVRLDYPALETAP